MSKRIVVKYYYFSTQSDIWKGSSKQEKNKTLAYLCQKVHDLWIENSIPSVDCQNGRELVNCRKSEYIKKYNNIKTSPPLDETSKTGTPVYKASRRIVTCTVGKMQSIVQEQYNVKISLGKINNLKSFFLTNATGKEKILHLYKPYQTTRLN